MPRTIVQTDITLQQLERVLIDFETDAKTGVTTVSGLAVNYHAIDDQGRRIDPVGYSRTFVVPLTGRLETLDPEERQGLEAFLAIVEQLLLPPINRHEERAVAPKTEGQEGG